MLLKNAKILTGDWKWLEGDLRISGTKIAELGTLTAQVGEDVRDLNGNYLIPGLIETHFHGAMNEKADSPTDRTLKVFSEFEASRGITTFVPGTSSIQDEAVERFLELSAEFMKNPQPGAKMAGVYLEGPFISEGRKGGHRSDMLQKPSAEKIRHWQKLSGGIIKKTVVAPELEGAEEFVRAAVDCGIVVEIGHSVASYEKAIESFGWGITLATHTYNGMNPLNHREPGVLGAVLTDERITCELIADFGHVAPPAVKLAYLAKGEDKINIISDSMHAAGLGDGRYEDWPGRVTIVTNGISRMENGTITGSACTIMEGLRNLVSIGIPLASAVKMCAYNPAKMLKIDSEVGSIECGKCADLVVLDPQLNLVSVLVDGKTIV